MHKRFLSIEFPRFDLGFELHDGKLHSRDYQGYHLASCQQLDNQLLGFGNCMILQQKTGIITRYKMIVHAGAVTRDQGIVTIDKSPEADIVLHFHTYDIHQRLKSLEASSIEARLQLASLYAATGSLLPEHGSKVSVCGYTHAPCLQ